MQLSLEGEGPLYRRLYRGLRAAILDGRLPAGGRLPSTRTLAADLGVSRNVVLMAFDQLFAEGYIEGRVGSGTFVARSLPDGALTGWTLTAAQPARLASPRLSAYARRVLAMKPMPPPGVRSAPPGVFDFRYGLPAFADFPHETWRRLLARRARATSVRTLSYGFAFGHRPLREAIAAYLRRARGVVATWEQVAVVNGSQQALDLATRLLLDRGDRVVMEEPGYLAARQTFAAAGARVLARRVDESGLDVSRLPPTGVRLAYVTPSHQFPTGYVLSLSRRLELLRWAEKAGAYVLEDDYDSEFRYEGRPVAPVQGLDRSGRVLYVGTFSKVLFPSLRMGYLVVPPPLVRALAPVRWLADYHTPTFEQEVLTDFITEGHFESHLRRARARNAARRAALLEALDEHLGARVRVTGAAAGIHVVVWVRGLSAQLLPRLIERAAERNVGIYSAFPHYVRPPREAALLLGYASLTEREIRSGVKLLAEALRSLSP